MHHCNQAWKDEALKWVPETPTEDSRLHFSPDEIWVPDITLYNSADPSNLNIYGKTNCLVNHTGFVQWVPPTKFIVYCDLNLKKWPRDTQSCTVTLGSWTYHSQEIDLHFATEEDRVHVVADFNKEDMEWELLDKTAVRISKKYECCPNDYTSIGYTFTLVRRSTLYTYTVIVPIVCTCQFLHIYFMQKLC